MPVVTLRTPKHFNLWPTIYSHGWCSLPPFRIDKENAVLNTILRLPQGKTISAAIAKRGAQSLTINLRGGGNLTKQDIDAALGSIRECLRLEEDFSDFYREAQHHGTFRWIPKRGAGRLLRAQTAFEDTVKMMCTTNCSWALTEIMIGNLCTKLGEQFDDTRFAFPTPAAIAGKSEKFLRREIRAGYRAPYLLELSRKVVNGVLDIERWRSSALPTEELFEEVRSVKGIGPYAAGNILKLLGRYDYLGIDSWCRKKFFELHKNGRKGKDGSIERFYKPFGTWRGLFFWLDVTKYWYDKEFPF